MEKPSDFHGYNQDTTNDCFQLLVTLVRKLGPWRDKVVLIGGLVPSLKFRDSQHAGTTDIDLLLDTEAFEEVEAYKTLRSNLKNVGLSRGRNAQDAVQLFRWTLTDNEGKVRASLDLLCPAGKGPQRVVSLKEAGENSLSAFALPAGALAVKHWEEIEQRAELLGGGGVAKVKFKIVKLEIFILLKALAFEERGEHKDSYDLVFTLANCEEGAEALGKSFGVLMTENQEEPLYQEALDILTERFLDDGEVEGFEKDGPTHYAQFLFPDALDEQEIAKRDAVALVEAFLVGVDVSAVWPCSQVQN